jgi:uncharacterized protein YheU (UPF0270 family)
VPNTLKNLFGAMQALEGTTFGHSLGNKLTNPVRQVLDNGTDIAKRESLFQ